MNTSAYWQTRPRPGVSVSWNLKAWHGGGYTVRGRPRGRIRILSALRVSHSKAVLCGGFVRARRALNSPKRRFSGPSCRRLFGPLFTYYCKRLLAPVLPY
jgi:hypothetical protein